MDVSTFIIAWIVAITLMTTFSTLYSNMVGMEFREHILLSHLFTKGTISTFSFKQWLTGWIIHLIFGLVFLAGYEIIWHVTHLIRSVGRSLLFGIIIGVLGILGWMFMFKRHKNPPNIPYKHFYIHLFFAHLIFSLGAYLVYALNL